jgi:TolB-like protein
MNRSIILAAVMISAAILLNGYLERVARAPHPEPVSEKRLPEVREKSIAVLPFDNLSRDPDNANFVDGVQDEILTNLSKIADLKVISRTSVMQYRNSPKQAVAEIGKELGVTYVVQGSVQRADQRVRVNVQLIDARTQNHLWAETYDRAVTDLVAVEKEIAKNIADTLPARLSPR